MSKCPACGSKDIHNCIDCGAFTCMDCGFVWGKESKRIEEAILFIKEQLGESYYSDRLIAILEGRQHYPAEKKVKT